MTWNHLIESLKFLSEEQLNTDVTIGIDDDEFFSSSKLLISPCTDILDKDHPYLLVRTCE